MLAFERKDEDFVQCSGMFFVILSQVWITKTHSPVELITAEVNYIILLGLTSVVNSSITRVANPSIALVKILI